MQITAPKKTRFKTPAAVFILFVKDGKILLHRRKNTRWKDGMYDVPSGHVEEHEEVREAAAREAREETGLVVSPDDLQVVHLIHCLFDDYTYFQIYLRAEQFDGEPKITEPEKCDEMGWFDFDKLPENLVPYVRQAIEKTKKGEYYSVYGWDN